MYILRYEAFTGNKSIKTPYVKKATRNESFWSNGLLKRNEARVLNLFCSLSGFFKYYYTCFSLVWYTVELSRL